jgi:hypothetical protein
VWIDHGLIDTSVRQDRYQTRPTEHLLKRVFVLLFQRDGFLRRSLGLRFEVHKGFRRGDILRSFQILREALRLAQ